jgi:hypothetical protein
MKTEEIFKNAETKPDGYTLLGTVDFDSRIEEKPFFISWYNSEGGFNDSIREEGKINYDGLNDLQKLCLYVYAWNESNILPSKKGLLKKFSWTNYKLQKLIRQLNGLIKTEPTFDQNTGLLNGRGYFYCA